MKSLREMMLEVDSFKYLKGWKPDTNTFGDSLSLLHSEVSEALEAFREIGFEPRTREDGKPDDVPSELADVLIRLLSTFCQFCSAYDLEQEFERKMDYNRKRAYRHGGKKL